MQPPEPSIIAAMPTWAIVGLVIIGIVTVLPLGAAILFIGSWVGRVQTTATKAEREAEVARERAHDIANQLAAFKVEVSNDYVRTAAMDKLEARLVGAISDVRQFIAQLFGKEPHS